ncbi:MAG: toprim domain-containing protein [Bacteroidales bacterium]|nr:toprim domain-containing protein [Bacteroidales bacterium]
MEIADIKQKLSILTVLANYNLKPNKHGMLHCPFHENDKNPSLKIYTKTNTFFCFSCGASGDAIEFIQKYEKTSKHGSIIKAKGLVNPLYNQKPVKMEQIEDKNLLPRLAIMGKVAQDSKANFKKMAKAQEYLQTRGLSTEKLEAGYIGGRFAQGWNLPLQKSAAGIGLLKKTAADNYITKFKNCILFFTKNEKGQIIDLYGRSISQNGDARHFYLNGHHQGIYPKYPNAETKKLILTESIIDCETLLQQKEIAENYSIIALFGTNGFTPEIQEAIKGLTELEEIILFFDGDNAGKEAAIKLNAKLLQLLPSVKITKTETPEGEDVNSLIQGHDPEILNHLINERKPIQDKNEIQGSNSEVQEEPELNITNPDKITYNENELNFTIWGGIEKDNIHRLKINLLVQLINNDFNYYQDDVNLYSNGQLQRYIKGAAEELECSTTILKTTIRKLKSKIEEYRLKQIEQERKALKPKAYQMTKDEENKAVKFLKAKNLVKNTLRAIEKTGLVGEQKSGLLLYFLYLSRLFDEPLHAIIFGKSGSGKTYLQTKISECLPEESVRTITSLTENTLYYSAKGFWKHKVLLIEDLEGVYNAFLPLREFMSKQSITKLTTDKDAKGNNVQKVLVVEGPICVSGATTQGNIYEDNANRSFLIHIDETIQHMKDVMNYQRKLQAGLIDEQEQNQYRQILKNAQRLLRKVKVINPYAPQLDIPGCVFKKLRTNMHYLKLIEIITFYHQYQREWKEGKDGKPYIETTLEDIELANWLVKDTILRKSDELGGDLRGFFESLKCHLKSQNGKEEQTSFYAKEIRKAFRMHPQKLSRYLSNLEKRGMIKLIGRNRQTGYEYQIISWDDYQLLKNDVDILDRILEKLKNNKK